MAGRIVRYQAGDTVLEEGKVNTEMYKIISGKAEVYVGYGTKQEVIIGILSEQACFNEFGLLTGKPAIYTVIAYSDLAVLRIEDNHMEDFVKTNHKNIMDIMRNMANTMLTMRYHIELLSEELEKNKKANPVTVASTRQTMQRYLQGYMNYQLQGGEGINIKI